MQPVCTKSTELDWQPLVEPGIATQGIHIKALRRDSATGRPPTFLLKFEPGASYPNHNHPGGEEAFVLEGSVRFGSIELNAGDFLYTPPNASHAVYSKGGCVMLLAVPEEVEVL